MGLDCICLKFSLESTRIEVRHNGQKNTLNIAKMSIDVSGQEGMDEAVQGR